MKKNFISQNFIFFLRILALILISIATVSLIIFPLWAFAENLPKIYTIISLSLIFFWIIFKIVKICLKTKPLKILKIFMTIAFVACGIIFFVIEVLNEKRIPAFLILFASIILSFISSTLINRFIPKNER